MNKSTLKQNVIDLLRTAGMLWSEEEMERIRKECMQGATYVRIDDSFEVDWMDKMEPKREVEVYSQDRKKKQI